MLDNLVKVFDDFSKGGRVQDLAQLAKEYSFSFEKRQSFGVQPTEIKGFKAFAKKGTKRLIGISSTNPLKFKGKVRFYDYLKTKDLETSTTSIIEIFCEDIFTDYLMIQPKGVIKKMKGLFSSDRIYFPKFKSFHSQFVITSEVDEEDSILRESALSLMLDFPKVTCEAEGNHFLFYVRKKDIKIQDIIPTMEFAEEFVRLICFDKTGDFV